MEDSPSPIVQRDEELRAGRQKQRCERDGAALSRSDLSHAARRRGPPRKRMIHPLLQGLGIILIAPLALAGVGIFAAGAVVYGSGKLLVGLGDVITLGQLRRYTCGTSATTTGVQYLSCNWQRMCQR